MVKKDTERGPLTSAVLHILLALSTGERHGYGIMKQVEADSEGKVKMGPGTLYGSIGRMLKAGLIRESDKPFARNASFLRQGRPFAESSQGKRFAEGAQGRHDKRVDPEMADERRIYYKLTGAGRAALGAELERYRGVVAVAEGRLA